MTSVEAGLAALKEQFQRTLWIEEDSMQATLSFHPRSPGPCARAGVVVVGNGGQARNEWPGVWAASCADSTSDPLGHKAPPSASPEEDG
jgi:hypothetical protein